MSRSRLPQVIVVAVNLAAIVGFLFVSRPIPKAQLEAISPQQVESGTSFQYRGVFAGWFLVAQRVVHPAAMPPVTKAYILLSLPAVVVTALIAWPLREVFPRVTPVAFSWFVAGFFALVSSLQYALLVQIVLRRGHPPQHRTGV